MKKLLFGFLTFILLLILVAILSLWILNRKAEQVNETAKEVIEKLEKLNKVEVLGNTKYLSFSNAKKNLLEKIFADHQITFYCGSGFNDKKEITDPNGFIPSTKRGKKIEWEHIVPAYEFGYDFPEWENGHELCINSKGKNYKGRRCVRKLHEEFRYMESDLYNLVPSIDEINLARSRYPFGEITGEERKFGTCDMEIQNKKAEPTESIRGNIARTYMYMHAAYPDMQIINSSNQEMLIIWNISDPVDSWECERVNRVESIQGNENPIVKDLCISAGLWPQN